jgi:hypothetical protein
MHAYLNLNVIRRGPELAETYDRESRGSAYEVWRVNNEAGEHDSSHVFDSKLGALTSTMIDQ